MTNKTSLWLAAAVVAGFAFGFAGCGPTTDPMTTMCSGDAQCSAGEACHPVLRRCVTACTGASDCPDSAKTCATFGGLASGNDAGVRAFCQCSTDALCDRGSAGQVCQPATKLCGAKCTANSDCPSGATCNSMTGKCAAGSTGDGGAGDGGLADGGAGDGGTMMDGGMACTPGSCTAPAICTLGVCGAPAACVAPAFQPGSCPNGQLCATNACAEVPFAPASCMNFAAGTTPRAWNPASANGPIITEVTQLSFAVDAAFCGAGANEKRGRIRIRAYDPSAPGRLTTETGQPSLRRYQLSGNSLAVGANEIQSYVSSNMGQNAEFIVNVCTGTSTNSLSVGYAYENGNPVCVTLQ
ncbi:MAG: hypothetical protein INH41_22960 [Myxococcaceae bacterium]|jgi:hypothetical protein|nr:hypothetical protein [Myxococcaceae bacterium]